MRPVQATVIMKHLMKHQVDEEAWSPVSAWDSKRPDEEEESAKKVKPFSADRVREAQACRAPELALRCDALGCDVSWPRLGYECQDFLMTIQEFLMTSARQKGHGLDVKFQSQ